MSQKYSSKNKPPTSLYTQAVYDLVKKLKAATTDFEKYKIYDEFYGNYFFPKSFWNERINLKAKLKLCKSYGEIHEESVFQFNYGYAHYKLNGPPSMLMKKLLIYNYYKRDTLYNKYDCLKRIQKMIYPHETLMHYLMHFEEHSSRPISKEVIKTFEEMEKLYSKINAAENNLEEWLEFLKEFGKHEFVKQNIENRIGRNLKNKKLWKLYISYLRENDPQEMLQVYSKYCRFFLDDLEIKNEYKNATEKYGPVYVSWKNLFDFEFPESALVIKEVAVTLEKMDEWLLPLDLPFFYEYSKKPNNIKQNLSLPSPLIQYFITNARPLGYAKLRQTCKYFWNKKSKLHCYRFVFLDENIQNDNNIFFNEGSLRVTSASPYAQMKPFKNKNLVISMGLYFQNQNDNLCLSNFINNYFFECDVKYIEISHQKLTEKELKFLIGRGNVESFKFINSPIHDANGNPMLLEDILIMLSRVKKFQIGYKRNTPTLLPTMNKLSNLKFFNKFIEFRIKAVINEINPFDFCYFVKQNASPSSIMSIVFHENLNLTFTTQKLRDAVKVMLAEWIPSNEKPNIKIAVALTNP